MTELKLVPNDEPTELERLLMNAAANEKPSLEHKNRVREVLGLAIPLAAPPSGAEAAAPEAAAATGSSAGASVGGASTLAKALAGGVLGASAVGAVIFALATPQRSEAPPAPPPAPLAVERKAPGSSPAPAAPAAPAEEPAVAVSELPVATPRPQAKPKALADAKPAPAASADDDLREQIVLIEAARAHVAQHNPWPALQALDSYAAKFKGGSFEQEAAVLRMKAVEQTGDRARAASLARSFLERNPTSPHVERVRRIADPAEPR